MPKAKTGDTVQVHYTGKLDDGTVFDSSKDKTPLKVALGKEQVIPGFESAIIGMSVGDKKEEKIKAYNAYGEHVKEMVIEVQKEQFPAEVEFKIGQILEIGSQEEANRTVVKVLGVSGDKITLDGNHPLAGKDLTFEIELVSIN